LIISDPDEKPDVPGNELNLCSYWSSSNRGFSDQRCWRTPEDV
jgi:hypothetical protein